MSNQVVVFEEKSLATVGNDFLHAIVGHDIGKQKAEEIIANSAKQDANIDFELTRAALFMHNNENIDLHDIYANKKQTVSTLNRQILVTMGVLTREITDNDTIEYNFTDAKLKDCFYFDATLKEAEPEEYKRRHSLRNGLNIRLKRVCKAALALVDSKANIEHLVYQENAGGEMVPTILKGPKEIMGKQKAVTIFSRGAPFAENATVASTVGGLARVSDNKHKAQSKHETENVTKKKGEGIVNEKDFVAMINVTMIALKGREGVFSNTEKQVLKNLLTTLAENAIT